MHFQEIDVVKLVVNAANDRHGATPSEDTAIAWFFENKLSEMRKLAKDVAAQGAVYDVPLVKPDGENYIVFDGNRRTTCLKLLLDPSRAPSAQRSFFEDLSQGAKIVLPTRLTCQVEMDQNIIDAILQRRHNGTQGGIGQLGWDTRAKANHTKRTGRTPEYPVADLVEEFLRLGGYTDFEKIKLSNLERLLGSRQRRSEFGFTIGNNGALTLTSDKDNAFKALVRVAEDLKSGSLSLANLLRKSDADKYVQGLVDEGLLKGDAKPRQAGGDDKSQTSSDKKPSRPTSLRGTLIPVDRIYKIEWREGQNKVHDLWEQLQSKLKLDLHALSIAIVFRVFIEQVVADFGARSGLPKPDRLHTGIVRASEKLLSLTVYDEKVHEDIRKMANDSASLTGVQALHRVLHARAQVISKADLAAMWDNLEPFLMGCIRG